MKITKNVLRVKSTKDNYDAEESGRKRNTERWLDKEERDELEQMIKIYSKPLIHVSLVGSDEYFTREITDARPVLECCGRWYYVISW